MSSFKVKYMASVRPSENFNIGHNLSNIEDSNLIFGMHVHLMALHILSGERSRSKVKLCNIEDRNSILGIHAYLMELQIL